MKFHSAAFLCALGTANASSFRGYGTDRESDKASSPLRKLSNAPAILDLGAFIKDRAEGRIGSRLLPSGATFEALDTNTISVELRGDTFELGPLNIQARNPDSVSQVTHSNNGFQEQTYQLKLSGTVTREFTSSVTSGFRSQYSYSASVGFDEIAEVESSGEFEFSLSETEETSESVEESFEASLQLVIPPYTRIRAAQLVNTIVTNPSFSVYFEFDGSTNRVNCSPGIFEGQMWYCSADPNRAVGSSCNGRVGWVLCDDVQGLCNPGRFQGQRYHCPSNPRNIFTGESCTGSSWLVCNDQTNFLPGLCFYYRDSKNSRGYWCESLEKVFLDGMSQHSFVFTYKEGSIFFLAEGQFTGVGGREYYIDVDYECLSPWVLTPDGHCVAPSEAGETVQSKTFTSELHVKTAAITYNENSYRKERLVFDANGNLVMIVDMMDEE